MQKSIIFILCLMLNVILHGENESDSSAKKNYKTSIIIPCCAKHAPYLFGLLRLYEHQTELPGEIVISLSQSESIKPEIMDALQQELWYFPVTILLSKRKIYAGENRNRACRQAIGDIFICQDADDIPHPQRVEIINYFFKNFNVDHLMHKYSNLSKIQAKPFSCCKQLNKIPYIFPKNYREANKGTTNGNIAIARHVFEKIKWPDYPRAQDTYFNQAIYRTGHFKCIVVLAVIYGYRQYLSSATQVTSHLNNYEHYLPKLENNDGRKKQYRIIIIEMA